MPLLFAALFVMLAASSAAAGESAPSKQTLVYKIVYQKSLDMAEALKRHGVAHELVTVENGGHGLGGADPQAIAAAYARARAFIREHLD